MKQNVEKQNWKIKSIKKIKTKQITIKIIKIKFNIKLIKWQDIFQLW